MKEQERTRNLLISIIVLVLYLVLLFNINNLGSYWDTPIIQVTPYVIALSLAIILSTIGISIYLRSNIVITIIIWVGLYLGQIFLSLPNFGIEKANFITLLLDLLILSLSILISHWLVRNLAPDDFALKTDSTFISRNRVLEMSKAEPLIVNEIIRSRRYKYPVTVLAISLPDRLTHKKGLFKGQNSKKIPRRVRLRIIRILASQDRQSDLIVGELKDGCILLICPQLSKGEHSESVVQRIIKTVDAQLGIPLSVGISTFPNDDLTIDGVIKRAKEKSFK